MALERNQISIIEADVNRASIVLDELRDELIDHLCCEVEKLIDDGLTFEEAYGHIKKTVTIEMLQSIEENTIQQLDKNYQLMKNLMRITGNVSLILIAAGTVMRIFAITGSAIVLTSAFAILCLFFIPLVLYTYRPDPVNHKNRSLKFMVFFASVLFPLGILFRTMMWNGSGIMLTVAFVIVIFAVLPLTWQEVKRTTHDSKDRILFLFGLFALGVFILAMAFKIFHLPAATVLLATGSVLLVSGFLPIYTFREYSKTKTISSQFVYLVIASVYIVTMTILMSFGVNSEMLNLIVKN